MASDITRSNITPSITLDFLKLISDRYWSRVDVRNEQECWPWTGASRNGQGPTTLSIGGKYYYAYRLAFQFEYGLIDDGEGVRHSCNNVLCVNPKHLYTGDKYEWESDEAIAKRAARTAYMKQYMNDPNHPERRTKKRQGDLKYGKKNGAKINTRAKTHYAENTKTRGEYIQKYQMIRKIRAINYLGGACQSCGFEHPSALQFHHRDPSTKSLSVTTKELGSPNKYPWDTVIKPELDKCDLLCSNCHFIHHAYLTPEQVNELRKEVENDK